MIVKLLLLLVAPALAFAFTIQGPDEEDRADDQARIAEQGELYEHFDGDYETFREQVIGLTDRYEDKKRERFEDLHGGSENFVHSWDEEEND